MTNHQTPKSNLWNDRRFQIAFLVSVLVSLVFVLGELSGQRHVLTRDLYIYFPFALLLFHSTGHITQNALGVLGLAGVAIALFGEIPFYFWVIARALKAEDWRHVIALAVIHMAAAVVGLAFYR